ncbi:MAG: O-antigen ligase family protein [Candidatus Microgenomates bacterium]
MGITKKIKLNQILSPESIFIFLFLVAFPFGQIIRLSFNLAGLSIPLQPVDIIAGGAAIYALLSNLKKPQIFVYLIKFLSVAAFSYIVSLFIFKSSGLIYGLFYLIRLAAYFGFFIYGYNFVRKSPVNGKLLLDSLLAVSIMSAIFGWIQYFNFPALKPFMVWGWDEHLYRLVGTFLDPTYLGIIITFGLLISIHEYLNSRSKTALITGLFLLVSLAFTYSRASYLAFIGGIVVIGIYKGEIKKIIYLALVLAVLILVLPTSGNTILRITREFSALARIENYKETLQIFRSSPVFGVGYDNLCLARSEFTGFADFKSHSCSGSDSSLLFILVTTGIVGFIIFTYVIWNFGKLLMRQKYSIILASSSFALFIHSLFSNSLFYPWVIGWMFILVAINLRSEV